jgi:hypothetical protein
MRCTSARNFGRFSPSGRASVPERDNALILGFNFGLTLQQMRAGI